MHRNFSISVYLGSAVIFNLPFSERDDDGLEKHRASWQADIEKDLRRAGYCVRDGVDVDYDNFPLHHNGHFVNVRVLCDREHAFRGVTVYIREYTVESGRLNSKVLRDDAPDLWRIVDAWKERFERNIS